MAQIIHGSQTVTTPGTAVQLATKTQRFAWLLIQPRVTAGPTQNIGDVRLGGVPLTGDSGGIPPGKGGRLSPGDAAVAWPFGGAVGPYDLLDIWLDADNAGDGVQWMGAVL